MFTGIVQTMGRLVHLKTGSSPELKVEAGIDRKVIIGDSIAVNGACLTVIQIEGNNYQFNLSPETLKLSNFSDYAPGGFVNIELPLTPTDLLGGHLVSGHLDGNVRVRSIRKSGGSTTLGFTYRDSGWKRYLIHKGSVTLNGVSLTLSEVKQSSFSVTLIPHSLKTTNLQYLKIGERVNLELDLIGKYLYNLVNPEAK